MPNPIPQNRNVSEQYLAPATLPPAPRPQVQAPQPILQGLDHRVVATRSPVRSPLRSLLFGFVGISAWLIGLIAGIFTWQISSPVVTFMSSNPGWDLLIGPILLLAFLLLWALIDAAKEECEPCDSFFSIALAFALTLLSLLHGSILLFGSFLVLVLLVASAVAVPQFLLWLVHITIPILVADIHYLVLSGIYLHRLER